MVKTWYAFHDVIKLDINFRTLHIKQTPLTGDELHVSVAELLLWPLGKSVSPRALALYVNTIGEELPLYVGTNRLIPLLLVRAADEPRIAP